MHKNFFLLFTFFLTHIFLLTAEACTWSQRTLEQMTIEEKIGQLFMIAAYVDPVFAQQEASQNAIIDQIDGWIKEYHVGGLAYVGPSEIVKQIQLTNHYQSISKYPLLIAQDLEWGLSMRLRDGMNFPKNSTLASVDDNLIYEMGKEIGRQAKLIGVHMNLSPVLDVNSEPENAAINVRSFGDDPQLVARKGVAMIAGLQDAGLIASAKHFPGLGDIITDPHIDLPRTHHTRNQLNEVDLYPFKKAIDAGVLSIQTEHLSIPAIEANEAIPSSLSPKVVTELLQKELGFKGLVLSGALRMKALTNYFSQEEIVLKAFQAGSDMLLMPQNISLAYKALQDAFNTGLITEAEIDQRALKILQLKERAGLNKERITALPLIDEVNTKPAEALKVKLYQQAVKLLRDQNHLLPLKKSEKVIAYIEVGEAPADTEFSKMLRQKLEGLKYTLEEFSSLEKEKAFQDYSLIIVAVYPADPRRIQQIRLTQNQESKLKQFRVHGITDSMQQTIEQLKAYQTKVLVVYFGNVYGMKFFNEFGSFLMAYETDPEALKAASSIFSTQRHRGTEPSEAD